MIKGIDLFAGAGGFTEGAVDADVNVVWAANHWPTAVETHLLNHPATLHACQDLKQADWSQVPKHDVMLASPECKGHTPARGKEQKHHDSSRSTAWAVVDCAEYHRQEVFVIENVQEFINWQLYPAWEQALKILGYTLSPHFVDVADHGVPQNRKRVFIVGSRSKAPLTLNLPKREHKGIGQFIDWQHPRWSPVVKKGRSKATLARVKNGRREFGERFVMPYYSSGSGLTGRDLARPLGTVTTVDRWAVVDGDRMRMLSAKEYQVAMGFRDNYKFAASDKRTIIHLLGNAVPPQAATDILRELQRAA